MPALGEATFHLMVMIWPQLHSALPYFQCSTAMLIVQILMELQLVLNTAVIIIMQVACETWSYLNIRISERKFRWDLRSYLSETPLSANTVLEGIWGEPCSESTHHKLLKARVNLTYIAETLPHSQFKSE